MQVSVGTTKSFFGNITAVVGKRVQPCESSHEYLLALSTLRNILSLFTHCYKLSGDFRLIFTNILADFVNGTF